MIREKTKTPGIRKLTDSQDRIRWQVWYRGTDGKPHTQTLPLGSTERDAKQRRRQLLTRIDRGERVAPVKHTYDAVWELAFARARPNLKEKTARNYEMAHRVHLSPYFGHRRIDKITVDDVALFIVGKKLDGLAGNSIKEYLKPFRLTMKYAVRSGWITVSPVDGLSAQERPSAADQRRMRILSAEEIPTLLDALHGRYRALLAAAIFTGLRQGELLNLKWSDVDYKNSVIMVGKSKTEAGVRQVVLMPALGKLLKQHRLAQARSADTDYVFCWDTGTPINPRAASRWSLEAALTKTGIPHLRFHDLRHTFASILISQGLDVVFVADQLGHRKPDITLRVYSHLYEADKRRNEARTKLQEAFGGML